MRRQRQQEELEGRPPLVVAADSLPARGAAGEVRRSRAAGVVRGGAVRRWHHREAGVAAAEAPLDNHLDTPWWFGQTSEIMNGAETDNAVSINFVEH